MQVSKELDVLELVLRCLPQPRARMGDDNSPACGAAGQHATIDAERRGTTACPGAGKRPPTSAMQPQAQGCSRLLPVCFTCKATEVGGARGWATGGGRFNCGAAPQADIKKCIVAQLGAEALEPAGPASTYAVEVRARAGGSSPFRRRG